MSDVPEDFKLTICDKCSATFTIEIMERTFDESVIQKFFICPNCGKEYTVLITDKDLREKIGKRKRLSKALPTVFSEAVNPGLSAFVESHMIARTPFLPISAKR